MKLSGKINNARKFKKECNSDMTNVEFKHAADTINAKIRAKLDSKVFLKESLTYSSNLENSKSRCKFFQSFDEVAAAAELFNSTALPLTIYNRDKEKNVISAFLSPYGSV